MNADFLEPSPSSQLSCGKGIPASTPSVPCFCLKLAALCGVRSPSVSSRVRGGHAHLPGGRARPGSWGPTGAPRSKMIKSFRAAIALKKLRDLATVHVTGP